MLGRFGVSRAQVSGGDAGRCDLLALLGKDRWMGYADDMVVLATSNDEQSRLEFQVMLKYLRLDVSRALLECRADFLRNEDWNLGLKGIVGVHLSSRWHLFVLGKIPTLVRLGFPRFGSSIKRHVNGTYTGTSRPSLALVDQG